MFIVISEHPASGMEFLELSGMRRVVFFLPGQGRELAHLHIINLGDQDKPAGVVGIVHQKDLAQIVACNLMLALHKRCSSEILPHYWCLHFFYAGKVSLYLYKLWDDVEAFSGLPLQAFLPGIGSEERSYNTQ
jgi:hypothetical protein